MPNVVRFFRDSMTIDQNLIAGVNPHPGDTLVFGARQVTVSTLLPAYDYYSLPKSVSNVGAAPLFADVCRADLIRCIARGGSLLSVRPR